MPKPSTRKTIGYTGEKCFPGFPMQVQTKKHPGFLGCYSVNGFNYAESSFRDPHVGFRPVYEILDLGVLSPDIKDGDSVVIGTLFMNGKPVHIPLLPENGGFGEIEECIPGSTLEIGNALFDPKYQIPAIKVRTILIADQPMLNCISWDNLHQPGFC